MNADWEIDGTFEAPTIPCERRDVPRRPLMTAAWLWRTRGPQFPVAVRLLDHTASSVGLICPVALEKDEEFDISLERNGPRHRGLRVVHCEALSEDAFRVGGCM